MNRLFSVAALSVALVAPVLAQAPPASTEGEITVSAVRVTRLLRGINRVGFTAEQGAALLRTADAWDGQHKTIQREGAVQLTQAAAGLRASLARVESDPAAPSDAESAYQATVQRQLSREGAARQTAREQFLKVLAGLTEAQAKSLAGLAREGLLAARVEDQARVGSQLRGALSELERMRSASPEQYARMREGASRMSARVFSLPRITVTPGEPGPPGGPRRPLEVTGTPAPVDPAAQQQISRFAAFFDRVRAMLPNQWRQQQETLAGQLVREREAAQVSAISQEELLAYFVDEFLLQPDSPAALRARFAPRSGGQG